MGPTARSAEAGLLGERGALRGIVRRRRRIIGWEAVALTIAHRVEPEIRQMASRRLAGATVEDADEMVRGHGHADLSRARPLDGDVGFGGWIAEVSAYATHAGNEAGKTSRWYRLVQAVPDFDT